MTTNELLDLIEVVNKKDETEVPSHVLIEVFDCEPDVFKEVLPSLLV